MNNDEKAASFVMKYDPVKVKSEQREQNLLLGPCAVWTASQVRCRANENFCLWDKTLHPRGGEEGLSTR